MSFKDFSLKYKIGGSVCLAVALILIIYTAIVVSKTQAIAVLAAEEIATEMANRYGNQVKNNMEKALDASVSTAAVFEALVADKASISRTMVDDIQKKVLLSDETFYGIQSCFEPNALDGRDAEFKATGDPMWEHMGGAYGNYWWRGTSGLEVENLTKYDYANTRAWYKGPRDSNGPSMTEPYYTEVAKVNMATISVPVKDNGKFIGIVGIDFTLGSFQKMVADIKPMETGRAFIVSNKGKVVAHPNSDIMNKELVDVLNKEHAQNVINAIERGESYMNFMTSPLSGQEDLFVFEPILINGTSTPWSIGVAIPKDTIYEAADAFLYLSIALTIIALLIVTAVVFLIAKTITTPMVKSVAFAREIASGNLAATIDVDQRDEVGVMAATLAEMGRKLRQVVSDVRDVTDSVAAGSGELSSTAISLSQGATQQASAIEEVSASMEEMASNISQNADNALKTQGLASGASGQAEDGGSAVSEAVEAMREIADKISIIEEIARQTNLLALNAAIEAARAGEHGKGFAVVAAEVRKLAERSGVAAGEISQLAASSVDVADRAGELLSQLVPDIKETAELVEEITTASNEQNAGAGQINSAIQQLDQVVQQNASVSEEMSSTSEELSGQAEQLQDTVAFFNIGQTSGATRTVTQVRKPAPQAIAAPRPQAAPQPAAAPRPTAAPKPVGGGVSLDMDGDDDGDFERF